MRLIALFLTGLTVVSGHDIHIDASRIRAHTRFLASDLLEGRGVGARGGDLATEYLAAQLALIGAKPAGENGTFFQPVPLVGVETKPTSSLTASAKEKSLPLHWIEDFVGTTQTQRKQVDFDGEAVFVGHGITAPEFGWDDYRGTDVRGKVVVLFTNEPPSDDPKFFGGSALTYYGRWTYKFEEAARHGVVGAIIIHTTRTAGYGWDVVKSSWGREDPQVKLRSRETPTAFTGWVSQQKGEELAELSGKTIDSLLQASNRKGFRAFPMNFRLRGTIQSAVRDIQTRNVAGLVPGSDPQRQDEAVIVTAHWDHLGIGSAVEGDSIYNGAVDNATGCAMVLEMARVWAGLERRPARSALFLFVTAEEGGLRGSEYYAANPLIPPAKTILNINFDAFYPFGLTTDVVVSGAERTTLWPLTQEIASREGLVIKPDPRPEQGSYYRSDHFSMAKIGIPAFSIHGGAQFEGKPENFSETVFREYNSKHYHQPSDEYSESWDFSGLGQMAHFGFMLGTAAADVTQIPTWQPGDEFLPAREKSGAR